MVIFKGFNRKREEKPAGPELAKEYEVALDDIVITPQFAASRPGKKKIEGKKAYYERTGQFTNPCELTLDNTLIDGYCTYYLARRLHIDKVPCIYVDDKWMPDDYAEADASNEANS